MPSPACSVKEKDRLSAPRVRLPVFKAASPFLWPVSFGLQSPPHWPCFGLHVPLKVALDGGRRAGGRGGENPSLGHEAQSGSQLCLVPSACPWWWGQWPELQLCGDPLDNKCSGQSPEPGSQAERRKRWPSSPPATLFSSPSIAMSTSLPQNSTSPLPTMASPSSPQGRYPQSSSFPHTVPNSLLTFLLLLYQRGKNPAFQVCWTYIPYSEILPTSSLQLNIFDIQLKSHSLI